MKTQLDKYKDALAVVYHAIDSIKEHAKYGQGIPTNESLLKQALRLILNDVEEVANEIAYCLADPPPVYETVEEIVGWVNVYPDGSGGFSVCVHDTEEQADEDAGFARISCQPIKVTVQREKKVPVERSVTVEARICKGDLTAGDAEGIDCLNPFYAHPDFHGCKGYLTFTTTEDPTT